jgi:hypothetical protein
MLSLAAEAGIRVLELGRNPAGRQRAGSTSIANISGVYYVAASPASPYAQPRRLRRAFSRYCLHHWCFYYR